MNTFFDPVFLEGFIGDKLKDVGASVDTDSKVKAMVDSDDFDATLDAKLKTLDADPSMAMLAGFGGAVALKPMIKPFVADLGLELAPLIKTKLTDPKFAINITTVRDEIERCVSVTPLLVWVFVPPPKKKRRRRVQLWKMLCTHTRRTHHSGPVTSSGTWLFGCKL